MRGLAYLIAWLHIDYMDVIGTLFMHNLALQMVIFSILSPFIIGYIILSLFPFSFTVILFNNVIVYLSHLICLHFISPGVPPLVTRRLLEILTYLASASPSVVDLLIYFNPSASPNCLTLQHNKETSQESSMQNMMPPYSEAYTPIILFLKLLNKPLFLRSRVYLEKVFISTCFSVW